MLKKREEELLRDTKAQLVKGHAEMKRQTVEVVEAAVVGLKTDVARAEGDRQHFASSLVDAMNEVTSLRNKYADYDEWEQDEEYDDDALDKWYKDGAGYLDAKVVGNLDYQERVKRVGAPLKGPQSKLAEVHDTPGLIIAARKAAHGAAQVASDMTHNTKAYEKLSVPAFPKGGEMTNSIYPLGTSALSPGTTVMRRRLLG